MDERERIYEVRLSGEATFRSSEANVGKEVRALLDHIRLKLCAKGIDASSLRWTQISPKE